MKYLLATISLLAVTATPALADTSKANIKDHYKVVIEQTPYNVEVCKDVRLQKSGTNTEGAIIGGIIGGLLGNQFGKGNGKNAATGVGAITGAIIGGKQKPNQGGNTERRCTVETRYKELSREVYSHSTVTFLSEGKHYTLKFQR
jgi:uncharacterized protein YcfJ|tara:strand:- start:50 stop:484 length:435 start_codon:yes stop_codon:yes gene_type:complete